MSDGYNKVIDGELVKFETPNLVIEGVLKAYAERADKGKGPGHVYEVKTKNGVAAFFAPTLLHKKLSPLAMDTIVKITYMGETKTAVGNTLKNFDVGFINVGEAMYSVKLKEIGLEGYTKVADEVKTGGAEDLVSELNKKDDTPM